MSVPRVNCREKVGLRAVLDPRCPPQPAPQDSSLASYLPEVPHDRGVCPRVFCVETQLAILEGHEGEGLVEPPAGTADVVMMAAGGQLGGSGVGLYLL